MQDYESKPNRSYRDDRWIVYAHKIVFHRENMPCPLMNIVLFTNWFKVNGWGSNDVLGGLNSASFSDIYPQLIALVKI